MKLFKYDSSGGSKWRRLGESCKHFTLECSVRTLFKFPINIMFLMIFQHFCTCCFRYSLSSCNTLIVVKLQYYSHFGSYIRKVSLELFRIYLSVRAYVVVVLFLPVIAAATGSSSPSSRRFPSVYF